MTTTGSTPDFNHCLLCGSINLKRMPRYAPHFLVSCQNCSFVFSSRNPSVKELNSVYSAYQRGSVIPSPITFLKMNRLASSLMRLRQINTALDVGCGDGDLIVCFKEYGVSVYGTEYDAASAMIAANKGVKILSGGLQPYAPEGIKGFDLIAFTEVIEHVNNPKDILAHFFKLLSPGGLLYITTPNFCSIESKLLGPNWGMIAYPEHLCYYCPKTLHRLLVNAGFERVSLVSQNISVFRLVQFWLKKNTANDLIVAPEKMAHIAQDAFHSNLLLRMVKWLINKMLAATGMGSSLRAIYQRPYSPV